MKKIALFLISTLCLTTAAAQDDALQLELEEAPEIRRYTVEIIVFTYLEDVFVGTEQFPPDEPPPEEGPLLDEDGNPVEAIEADEPSFWVVGSGEDDENENENDERDRLELVLLTEDEYELSKAIRQFELLDAYKMIMHTGWTQPTYPEEETPPIELQLLGRAPDGLSGTLTLYLSRYLHLVVDLALDAPVEVVELPDENSFFGFEDARRQYGRDFDAPAPQPVRYRIQENRIVRNGELRYFDHPKFGVLARIAHVEEPEEEELEETESVQPLLSSARQ